MSRSWLLRRTAFPQLQKPRSSFHTGQRSFSTAELSNGIQLAFDLHEPPKRMDMSNPVAPIVFVHGLFGSKVNNRSISKALARDLGRPVYCLDMRNHGDSSHHPVHTYTALAEDLELFLQRYRLDKPTLIGHSMGAKVAMTVALRRRVELANLIPVDNAPIDAALKSDFGKYLQGMLKIDRAGVKKQKEADQILQEYEDNLGIRQFLLSNLVRNEDGEQHFRIPVSTLGKSLDNMADFPFKNPDEARWEGPTLFVRGTKSPYVADEMLPICGRFFPNFQVTDIESGHWVISEKPAEFKRAIEDFLQDKD